MAVRELLLELTSETEQVSMRFNWHNLGVERHTVAALCGNPEGMGRGQR